MILRQLSIAITISNSFVSFILLCHILTQSQSCFATDNLTQSKSISVSETLTSASQIFELGFFNSNSTAKKYVGIWYKKIPIRKVVWVANRENPLSVTDSGSSLTIGDDGNLRLLDGNQNTVWTTNITVYVNYSVAVLLYTGNLVRRDGVSGESLWEDLSHPCDTSLPGMRLGLNTRLLGKQKTIHRLEILFLGFHHRSHRKSSFGTIQFLSGEVGSGMDSSLLGNRKHVAVI
ncbi:G-type lectin S-receptor-like serine/threonine-protein kinase At1g11330 [Camellia sinensis]|uniref:G-type lectin S-receptor-like serine/threonine-protein kinase At1g11330 n=1 Tax=Camellia sinensis TaxID=4442 RepID=UPI0010357EC8|nr:G-type lectin S-receptor-like serine/threonine-protein kinase At1g11330 [Camellia sinensis]